MKTFFANVRRHLARAGRILVFLGTSGDAPYLRARIAAAGLSSEVVAQAELARDGLTVEYFTLRLTA
jgi:release factor glutamine methyltransferase